MKCSILKSRVSRTLAGSVAVFALLVSCGEKKKEAPAVEEASPVTGTTQSPSDVTGVTFDQEELNIFFKGYLTLQEALVASDPAKAGEIAGEMTQIPLEGMPEVSEEISRLSESDQLREQRDIFFALNKAMVPYLESHLNSGRVYQQFCPMAFENTGAFWFSDSQEILNPYFGDAMLRCGKVEKTYGAL
ncbi:MAG: DUF3347 domain-containing protein [Robiginitalea sp.]|jgi:hypothetical protein